MSTFWDLYHQIIQSITGNGSNTFAVIPEIKYENSQYSIPEQIFPAGSIINPIPDNEEVLEAIENLKIDFSSPILFMPPYGAIKDWSNERKKEFPGYRNVETIVLRNFVRRVETRLSYCGSNAYQFPCSSVYSIISRRNFFYCTSSNIN